MKQIYFILILLFTIIGGYSQKDQNDSIVYTNSHQYFVFYKNGIYKQYYIPCDICPTYGDDNLMSYGKYVKYKNKAYYLFSDTNFTYSSDLLLNVVEKKIENSSVVNIIINSPYENSKSQMIEFQQDDFFYFLKIIYDKGDIKNSDITKNSSFETKFLEKNGFYSSIYISDENVFSIPIDTFLTIQKIEIYIYPLENFVEAPFAKGEYKIINKESNYFQIEIPQFTYGYLFYKRYFLKMVEIIDHKTIGFDNLIYTREDLYNAKKYSDWHLPPVPNWRYRIGDIFNPYWTDEE